MFFKCIAYILTACNLTFVHSQYTTFDGFRRKPSNDIKDLVTFQTDYMRSEDNCSYLTEYTTKIANLITSEYNCGVVRLGETYEGTIQQTYEGFACGLWYENNQTKYRDKFFFDRIIQAAANFCRHSNSNKNSFQCSFYGVKYEDCNRPYCVNITGSGQNCKTSKSGAEYTGNISYTFRGYECQAWYRQTPHKHSIGMFGDEFPDNDIYAVKNYCRNPGNYLQIPWCFTTQPAIIDFCAVPPCDISDELKKNISSIYK